MGERICRQTDCTATLSEPLRYVQTSRDMEHGANGAAAVTSEGELYKEPTTIQRKLDIDQDKKCSIDKT